MAPKSFTKRSGRVSWRRTARQRGRTPLQVRVERPVDSDSRPGGTSMPQCPRSGASPAPPPPRPMPRSMRSSPVPGALAALVCLIAACESTPPGTDPAQVPANQVERMAWWRDARFGMFIHWGLYAIPAGKWNNVTGHGEWIRDSAHIPVDVYEKFQPQWNPVNFDPDAWAKMAADAGMKYLVITS